MQTRLVLDKRRRRENCVRFREKNVIRNGYGTGLRACCCPLSSVRSAVGAFAPAAFLRLGVGRNEFEIPGGMDMYAMQWMDLKKMFGTRTVFAGVSGGLLPGEKVGLVGPNGVGKSTFLHVLCGKVPTEDGTVLWDRTVTSERVGLLTQQTEWGSGESVKGYVRAGKVGLLSLGKDLNEIEGLLSVGIISREIEELLERYGELQERYESLGGYSVEAEVERVLREVGLPDAVWEQEVASLSGGQKTRAQLARLLLQEPEVLLLDEPTNHLDGETIEWLERFVRGYAGTVLAVSHDRVFLDRAVTRILELRKDGMGSYPGDYTAYALAKKAERQRHRSLYEKQQAEARHLQESVDRFRLWAQRAHGGGDKSGAKKMHAKMRHKGRQLEKLQAERVAAPRDQVGMKIGFAGGEAFGNRAFLVEGVAVRFAERTLYEGVTFAVEKGQRVALVGPNGCGKSTLLKVLCGEMEPSEGEVRRSPSVRIGYFGQEVERLDPTRTVLAEVLEIEGLTETDARTILGSFLFRKEEVGKKVGELSQGEKCRVAFVKLMLADVNVLVLDEPTNYLDILSRERMEEVLREYSGTLLVVSHDRRLVERLATQVLVFADGAVTHYPGTWQEWQERQARRAQTPVEVRHAEARLLLQMELSRLAEQAADGQLSEEKRAVYVREMDRVSGELRALHD